MPRRPIVLALAAAATALAGCGGGDPTAFAGATDRTCRDVASAVTTLRQELVRREGSSVERALRSAIDAYAGRIERAASALAAADPPGDQRDFRDDAVGGLREHAKLMREAARAASRGSVPTTLAAQLQRSGPAALPEIPDEVLEHAPACRAALR